MKLTYLNQETKKNLNLFSSPFRLNPCILNQEFFFQFSYKLDLIHP